MRSIFILRTLCCVATIVSIAVAPSTANAADPTTNPQAVQFDIKPQPLASALNTFALQSHQQILFTPEVAKGKTTQGVRGVLTADTALTQLLAGTGLSSSRSTQGMLLVSQADAKGASADSRPPIAPNGATEDQSPSSPPNRTAPTPSSPILEEVLVTAQKREERLQDVPVPVTVLGADSLLTQHQLRLQDFFSSVPNFSVAPGNQSSQLLSIRGITTGNGNPTVGIVVDDVPFGSSTQLGGSALVPDIDPGDLQQIEVLRGPQGTLYGASSMGGLLKFVTLDPSTDTLSGRLEAGFDGVQHGSSVGYTARGSANVPVGDTLAIRLSGFTRKDPGYIDNPVQHFDGVNEAKYSGGHLSALWRPTDDISLKLSALYQDARGDGSSDVDDSNAPGYVGRPLGDLQQNYMPGTGGYDRKVQAYSAILKAKIAIVDFTSLTGYSINQYNDSYDFNFAGIPALFGGTGTVLLDDNRTNKFSQEIRLSSSIDERFDWLLGGFYTHESSSYLQRLLAVDASTGKPAGAATELAQNGPTTFEEYAGFADLTVHFTEQFDVQFGGRESQIRQTYAATASGPYAGPPVEELRTSGNAFTYLVTPRLKLTPDLMLYARAASGYRAGGPNTLPGGVVPIAYAPDKTQNYELGMKADFLDHRLSFDASVFRINWTNIQVSLQNPQNHETYNGNASDAKSQGVELSTVAKPLPGLRLAAWVSWDDADLTQAIPVTAHAAYGVDGERLPFSSRFSGSFTLDQEFRLPKDILGTVGAAVAYVGDREGTFRSSPTAQRQSYPGYARTDLHAGATWNAWAINVFVNNVTDKRGILQGGIGYSPEFAFVYIQPRTAGVSVTRTF